VMLGTPARNLLTPRARDIACVLAALMVAPAAASQTSGAAETAKIGARVVTLQSRAAGCELSDKTSNSVIQLDLAGPCRIARRGPRATPQHYDYPKVGTVIYVFGKPDPVETFAGKAQVKASDQCSSQAQAVVFARNGKMETRPAKRNGIFCPHLGLDEKDFYAAAFPVK
jgi:hypothetical protein